MPPSRVRDRSSGNRIAKLAAQTIRHQYDQRLPTSLAEAQD